MKRAPVAARGVASLVAIAAGLACMLEGGARRVEAEPVITAAEAEEIRFMLRSTGALAQATDVVLDEALLKPYSSDLTWLQAFGVILAADKVVERLQRKEYGAAALEASWAVVSLEYGSRLRAATFPASFSYLASAPIRLSLDMFARRAFDAALNRQLAFYITARSTFGKSHDFVMAGASDDDVLFTDSGWIYLVGDMSAPAYGPRIPAPTYSPQQVFGLALALYNAERQQNDVERQKTLLLREFNPLLLASTDDEPTPPPTTGGESRPINSTPVIVAPSAGSTSPVIGSPVATTGTSPPPSGGSVPALLAELGALTGNVRYAAFSDALANARVPARLSVQATADIGRGMSEYNEPYIRLIAGRIIGPLMAAQVDRLAADSQGLARFKIVGYLAGLLPGPLRPTDINLLVRNMELYRAPTIAMLAPRLAPNMGAREVIALFGSMSSPVRLATLSELKSARKLKYPMPAEELNAIAVTFGFLLEGAAREVLQQP